MGEENYRLGTRHLMKGNSMPYKAFVRTLVLAGAVALAPISPAAVAQAPAKFIICVVGTTGPVKIGTDPTAPIKYGFKVACSNLSTGVAASPDTRTIHVQLQTDSRSVDSFTDTSTDANIEVTHLYSCFGGPEVRYRIHWDGESSVAGGNVDKDNGDSDWVPLTC